VLTLLEGKVDSIKANEDPGGCGLMT